MKEISQYSDFALKISFFDISGDTAHIRKFKFTYLTPLSEPIFASFDGENYSTNCRPEADGIVVLFDNPKFNVGQLTVRREYEIESSRFADGLKNVTEVQQLPIMVVHSFSAAPLPASAPIPIPVQRGDIVWIETVVVETIKGDNGGALDYTLLNEQLLPGQFWIGRNGQQKQLYGRRLELAVTPTVDENGEGWLIAGSLQPVETIFSIEGVIKLSSSNQSVYASPLAQLFRFGCFSSPENYANNLTVTMEGIKAFYSGKPITLNLFVKYTKL